MHIFSAKDTPTGDGPVATIATAPGDKRTGATVLTRPMAKTVEASGIYARTPERALRSDQPERVRGVGAPGESAISIYCPMAVCVVAVPCASATCPA